MRKFVRFRSNVYEWISHLYSELQDVYISGLVSVSWLFQRSTQPLCGLQSASSPVALMRISGSENGCIYFAHIKYRNAFNIIKLKQKHNFFNVLLLEHLLFNILFHWRSSSHPTRKCISHKSQLPLVYNRVWGTLSKGHSAECSDLRGQQNSPKSTKCGGACPLRAPRDLMWCNER